MEDLRSYAPFGVAALVGLLGFAAGDWSLLVWLIAAAIACGGVVWLETRWGIFATALLGLGASSYLFSRKLDSSGFELCAVNSVQNCDLVNSSAASEIAGVPIALLGCGYFLGLAAAAALNTDEQRQPLFRVTLLTAAAGCLYSLYLFSQMMQLGAICPMCYAIYMSCGILVWAGLRGLQQTGGTPLDELGDTASSTSFVTVFGTLVAVVLIGMSNYNSRGTGTATAKPVDPDDADAVEQLRTMYAPPSGEVALQGDEPVLGDPNAPYIVLEYADFGCPHCAMAAVQLKELVKQHPEIQVRFRPFALSGACNPALPPSKDGIDRCRAAMAAECATNQGRFWDYSALVFANQRDLSDAALEAAAQQAGLDVEAWKTCMQEVDTASAVVADAEAGFRAGVRGTPTLFLKGVQGDRWLDVCAGPEGILMLTQLHQDGSAIPDPKFGSCEEAHGH
ncbi:MAG: thioredoxin domain-containing protein [Myxococcota bacterium]